MEFTKKTYLKLNTVFGKETEFSKWLATDGIEYLKEALGIELITEGTEVKPNGKFSTDIVLSVDPQYSNGKPSKVVIENQYGRTDHEHFSKLITYAVTNEAKYAVWIAEDIHSEHKTAITWLNDNTNDNINFYVFKAVVKQIGSSQKCFTLIPICEPKEELKINMSQKKDVTALGLIQLKFWTAFSGAIDSGNYQFKSRKARTQHWYDISIGSSDCHISICMLSIDKKARIDLWIADNKNLYDKLFAKKDDIEKSVGHELIWDRKDESKASTVSYEIEDEIDIYDDSKYDDYIKIILNELSKNFIKISKFVK